MGAQDWELNVPDSVYSWRKLQVGCDKILSLTKQLNKANVLCSLINCTAVTASAGIANQQAYSKIIMFISQNPGQKQIQKEIQHSKRKHFF
jgi:hypothetical protein